MKFYRLSDAIFYDCINTIYQFIKFFFNNKMSIFLRHMEPLIWNCIRIEVTWYLVNVSSSWPKSASCIKKWAAHEKTHLRTYGSTEDSNEPAHLAVWSEYSLSALRNYILSYPKCAQWRFSQSDVNLRWAHMSDGTFSYVTVHMLYSHQDPRHCWCSMKYWNPIPSM